MSRRDAVSVGDEVIDQAGESVGQIQQVVLDERAGVPKWVACRVDEREDSVLVPVAGLDLARSPVQLAVSRSQVLSCPSVAIQDGRVAAGQRQQLERYYASSAGAPAEDEVSVVRSEEELALTTRTVESGRVRLIKRVITETVTRTVEVRREELHIERIAAVEPGSPEQLADDSVAGREGDAPPAAPASRRRMPHAMSERLPGRLRSGLASAGRQARPLGEPFTDLVTDLVLMQEEVVISKRVVPRERVRLTKQTLTEQRQVTNEIRKEQVELDDQARANPRSAAGDQTRVRPET